ncbi:MAG TPA: CotH kinase family protein [Haliangium sp.]|nr:CotH kinase family protein [Haliangium sp.]
MVFASPRIKLCGLAILLCSAGCTGTVGGSSGPPGPPDPPDGSPDAVPPRPRLLLSEIMYRPVLEDDFVERHEFVEIHNPEARDVPLDGWSLGGDVGYDFPAGSVLPAGGYIVVAARRDALLGVTQYQLDPGRVYGDWAGALDNGGGDVLLRAPDQTTADAVSYDDEAPWPEAADALGASEDWLRPELLPMEQHRYLGHSLERVSFEVDAFEIENWDVSPLDQPSPGRANASFREQPLAVVLSASVGPRDAAGLIQADDEAVVRVRLGRLGEVSAAELDYYVDDLATTTEAITTVSLRDDGAEGDEIAGDRMFTVILPPLPENTIVRYRVRVKDGGESLELRQISPRPSSPYAWHAYFVSPVFEAETPTYQIFISPESWTKMWTNIEAGRAPQECTLNPTWDAKVPAVFVYEGKVYDVLARHQGSRYQRTNGAQIQDWPGVGPDAPDPLRALSWHLNFPRYRRFEGRRVLTLNKLIQTCPGMTAGVGMRLFAEAGVPASHTRYARLFVNGYYYRYMLDIASYTEDFLEDYHEAQAERPGGIEYQVGHLFKATGVIDSEGPWGPADGSQFGEYCGFSPAERYAYSYERKTHEWLGHENLIALIDGMHQARAQGPEALRAFLAANFDVDVMLSYIAVMNWSVPFDDLFHNYYLYQRIEDGKWILMPWDLDRNFGDWRGERGRGPTSSIYMGEDRDPDNRGGWWNYFKDSFLEVYRGEFEQRLRELNQTVLHPDHVSQVVDEVASGAKPAEAAQSLSGVACSFTDAPERFKQFARDRHNHVTSVLGLPQ